MKTKKQYKHFAFVRLTAVVLLLALLSISCGKMPQQTAETHSDNKKPTYKTHIFSEKEFPLPDNTELLTSVTPYWDTNTSTLTFTAYKKAEIETEDNIISDVYTYFLISVNLKTSDIISETILPLHDRESLDVGTIYEDIAVFALRTNNESFRLVQFKRNTGTVILDVTIDPYFQHSTVGIAGTIMDEKQNTAILAQDEIIILNEEGAIIRSELLPSSILGTGLLNLDENTFLVLCIQMSDESLGYCTFDEEHNSFGDVVSVGSFPVKCGIGYDLCVGLHDGVYGQDLERNKSSLIVDYSNSGIQNAQLWFVADPDNVIFIKHYKDNNDTINRTPALYIHQPDVDISNMKILHLAYAYYGMTNAQEKAVSDFNRTHADCQIVIDDYTEIEDGFNRLSIDMVSGVYKPDILLGVVGTGFSNYISTAAEKGLYVNLSPYLESDKRINRENLIDSVERVFDDGDGGIWGLVANVSVSMTFSTVENLGKYAEQGYWTLNDLIDYIESLPDGIDYSEKLTQSTMAELVNGALLAFVDDDTCSFDSPEFLRCLNFIKSLPTDEEYLQSSTYPNMDKTDLVAEYLDGRIVTARGSFGSITDYARKHMQFGTKDWIPIGDPAAEQKAGAGIHVYANGGVFLITSYCENPDLAWELCSAFFVSDEGQGGFPVLKSDLKDMAKVYIGRQYLWQYDGIGKWSRGDGTITDEDRQKPHVSGTFTEEDYEKLVDILNVAGVSVLEARRNEELKSIVKEEISTFLSGVGTAEDCATKIQSRVSIWLAEHK